MLSRSLLAARSRLLRSSVLTHCASIATRSLDNNVTFDTVHLYRLQVSKSHLFSTFTSSKDENDGGKQDEALNVEEEDEESQSVNGELSPLERLMQHSQQFQLDDDDDDSQGDLEGGNDNDRDESLGSSWQMESNDNGNTSSNDRHSFGTLKRNTLRHRGNSVHHQELGRMAVDHLVEKDMDEINFDGELEKVWDEDQVKQRKFYQALRRVHDKDHVCTNCGERGHRARNCLVPRICSNCGNFGHTARQCRFRRNPDTIEEFLMQEKDIQAKRKRNRKVRAKAAQAVKNPGMPLPVEVPTSDFNKRNEILRRELDAELDAYADKLEEQARKRRELKTTPKGAQAKPLF